MSHSQFELITIVSTCISTSCPFRSFPDHGSYDGSFRKERCSPIVSSESKWILRDSLHVLNVVNILFSRYESITVRMDGERSLGSRYLDT